MFNDYMLMHSTFNAPLLTIAFNTAVAATIIALLWFPLAEADDRPSGIPDEAKYVKVERVIDGDTIVLMDSTRVRLHGIDTPERDQPYGSEATTALKYLVETSVYIVEVDTDRYGRTIGQLYHSTEGYDINASMVCAGHAWWYERTLRTTSCLLSATLSRSIIGPFYTNRANGRCDGDGVRFET